MYWVILNHLEALAPFFLVIVTFIYVVLTRKLVEENKKLRDEQYRPRVVAGYEISKKKKSWIIFVVKNIGIAPAYNIRLDIKPDFIYAKKSLSQISFFKNGIAYLLPNQDVNHYLFNMDGVSEEIYKSKCYGTVTFNDALEKEYIEKFIIDFSYREGLIPVE